MKRRLPRPTTLVSRLGACAMLAALAAGCGAGNPTAPASLQTPRSFAVARGPVCMTSVQPSAGVVHPEISPCAEGTRGAIGLIANQDGNSVSVVDMSRDGRGSPARQPRLVDLDSGVPGVTGIAVGDTPVDVAAGDGTTAYVVNQSDQSISVINLWQLQALRDPIVFDQAPKKAVVTPGRVDAAGKLAVALTNPSRLWLHEQVDCPSADADCGAIPVQPDGHSFELPGAVSDMIAGPAGNRIYAIYSDASFASVIAVDDQALADFDDGCLDGGQAPCEVARVGLTFDCSNGVDDDGDGLIDRADPQCYGPRGAESPDGIGRNPLGACSNGMDDDGDGQVDRDDPDCLVSGADSEETPLVEDATLACMDQADNDGDGAIDYPADTACYGSVGQTEQASQPLGFVSVGTDPFGKFLYVVDRAQNQLLVVDATHLELIDAVDTGGRDRTAFSSQIGIAMPPSPTAVDGRVDRRVVWRDPRPEQCDPEGVCQHAIVSYNYGAWVATDGGFAYNASALTTYCEITAEAGAGLITSDQFFSGSQALADSAEADCLQVPEFPVSYDSQACQAVEDCSVCQIDTPNQCDTVCADVAQNRQDCLGQRLDTPDGVQLAFNPTMELVDSFSRQSRVRGLGTCETSDAFVSALRTEIEGPVDTSCISPLRPQPVAPGTSELQIADGDFERASLLENSTLVLAAGEELNDTAQTLFDTLGEQVDPFEVIALSVLGIDDQSVVNEAWSVTWEGVIPDTQRDDGLVSETPGAIEIAGLDLCDAGVQAGDRLTIVDEPIAADGSVPESCQAFVDPQERRGFRTWTIDEVRPHELVLSVIPDEQGGQNYVDELPSRDCFAEGMRIEIRVNDEWSVVGDRTGFLSQRTSVLGTCQPRFGADNPRLSSRVKTGELYEGPYLSFQMTEGDVAPQRGDEDELAYRFSVERNFRPDSFETTTLLPTQVAVESGLPAGRWLIIPDAASNVIYFRNLSRSSDEGEFLLR